jgi:hypothetical protein
MVVHVHVDVVEPALHGVEPVQPAGVEGGAEEPAAVPRVADCAGGPSRELAEPREPPGVDRTCAVARRAVHEAGPLTGHGVLVAAGDVERAPGVGTEVGGDRHEAVVAVDDHEGALVGHRRHDRIDVDHEPGVEQHVADEDEVVAPSRCGRHQPLVQRVQRRGRHPVDDDAAGFLPACELAGKAVELRVGGQHPGGIGKAGHEPHDELVGVRRDRDGRGVGQPQPTGDVRAHLHEDLAEHAIPLLVMELGGVEPRLLVGVEGHVRPGVVAVRGGVEASGVAAQEPGEVALEPAHDGPL